MSKMFRGETVFRAAAGAPPIEIRVPQVEQNRDPGTENFPQEEQKAAEG
jgi:hypothetical protein